MSNIKEVYIKGWMPFDSYEHKALNQKLGVLNAPTIGIRIKYLAQEKYRETDVENHYKIGNRQCLVSFVIEGQEAFPQKFFDQLTNNINAAGGEIEQYQLIDVEENILLA